jgi:hypothetical protein
MNVTPGGTLCNQQITVSQNVVDLPLLVRQPLYGNAALIKKGNMFEEKILKNK